MKSGEVQHIGAHADDRVRSHGFRVRDQPVKRVMARLVEHIAEFSDFAAHQRFQSAGDAADGADRVRDIAEYEFLGFVAGVHVAIQFLGIAGAGEQRGVGAAADTRSDEQEFRIAAKTAQFGAHADDSVDLFAIGFRPHALERRCTAFVNHLRHIGNFAAHDAAECRADAAEKAHRLHAVAYYNAARGESLEAHAIDFVARQTGQFECALHAAILSYSGLAVDAHPLRRGFRDLHGLAALNSQADGG